MNIEQCEQRNNSILQAWREWKEGKNELSNFDCAVLAEMFSIKYPRACQRYLEITESKEHARTTAPDRQSLKTIFRFLARLYMHEEKTERKPERKLIGICETCGTEIYEGDEYAEIDGCYYCDYCGGEDGLSISELKEQNRNKTEE